MSYTTQAVPTDAVVSTFAGSTDGATNGTGTNATFNTPTGAVFDSSGNLYVTDRINNSIRKITPLGVVTTFVGGSSGTADGTGTNAQFNLPLFIALDSSGNFYVTDGNNHRIRKITPSGVVTTLAGSTSGSANGNGTNAQFNIPHGIIVDSSGNIYVADTFNYCIRKITSAGIVTTVTGSSGIFAVGITLDSSGNFYVTETSNLIRKITPLGVVTTFVGGSNGTTDGTGANAQFTINWGITIDSSGNLYVSDDNKIRKITSDGVVSTLAGSSTPGSTDGVGSNVGFNFAWGLAIDLVGNLYVVDRNNHRIRKITLPSSADPNIYGGIPITGTLLTSFNPGLTASTITIPASTTNAKVASFTVAASSLPLKTSVTGVWSLVLYATVGLSTSPASFYFEVVDGATTVATGATTTSVNQSSPMQLYKSNLSIPARTYSGDLTLNIYATTQASSSLTLGFNGSTISYVNTTIPTVGTIGATGPTGSPVSGSLVTLSTYTGTVIRNAVAANNSSITTVWSNALPTAAKGRAGTLGMFFNMYSLTQFASNTSFDYGVYIDGSSISYGESNTSRYVQTTTSTYAFSSNGFVLGVGGMTPYQPISFPLYIPPQANALTIGFANANVAFSPVQSISLGYNSNILTASGTSNTVNFVPQNTFTTTGNFTYTVPTNTSAGVPLGVFIYLWGAGGQSYTGLTNSYGGTGGFVSGYYACAGGTALNVVVGQIGGQTATTGGGGNQFSGNPRGGGFSGVFFGSVSQSNAIAIAGGGGGASESTLQSGGFGGYPTGGFPWSISGSSNWTSPGPGTQSAGGVLGTSFSGNENGTAGLPLIGGFGGYGPRGGGGGGGYWGGGGAGSSRGGGGGSSYIGGLTSATYSNGISYTQSSALPADVLPGGSSNIFYVSGYGHANGGTGLVVIIPAVGTNPVYMGVNARLLAT
jgi:hypothetical protein